MFSTAYILSPWIILRLDHSEKAAEVVLKFGDLMRYMVVHKM